MTSRYMGIYLGAVAIAAVACFVWLVVPKAEDGLPGLKRVDHASPARTAPPSTGGNTAQATKKEAASSDHEEELPSAPPDRSSRESTAAGFVEGVLESSKTNLQWNAQTTTASLKGVTDAVVRASGHILAVVNAGELNVRELADILADKDPRVSLTVLGWLRDAGRETDAEKLLAEWQGQGLTARQLMDLFEKGPLETGAGRAALEIIMRGGAAVDDGVGFLRGVARDSVQAADVRLKAALMLRDVLDAGEYQREIRQLAGPSVRTPGIPPSRARAIREPDARQPDGGEQDAADEKAGWAQGIQQLAQRAKAPAALLAGPPRLMVDDVDLAFAEANATGMELLALDVEYVLSRPDGLVEKGVVDRLREYMANSAPAPDALHQQAAVWRLNSRLKALAGKERNDIPPLQGGGE